MSEPDGAVARSFSMLGIICLHLSEGVVSSDKYGTFVQSSSPPGEDFQAKHEVVASELLH